MPLTGRTPPCHDLVPTVFAPTPGPRRRRAILSVAAGFEPVLEDRTGGAKTARPGLEKALDYIRAGDTLVVWRLDRLGRSLPHLKYIVGQLQERGVGFRSLQEAIDTTSSTGNLVFQIFGAIAEFERNLIRERTQAGLAAARARGRKGGRPKKLTPKQQENLYQLYDSRQHSVAETCEVVAISRSGAYGYLRSRKATSARSSTHLRIPMRPSERILAARSMAHQLATPAGPGLPGASGRTQEWTGCTESPAVVLWPST